MEASSSTCSSDQVKLFVGGLLRSVEEEFLFHHFAKFGEVEEVVVVRDRLTGNSKGFAFVRFVDHFSVDRALEEERHVIQGKIVEVKRAIPKGEQRKFWNQDPPHSNGHAERFLNENQGKKIFLGGLSPTISSEGLKSFFEQFGRITDVVVMHDSTTNRPRGFGFITFESEESVDKVLQESYYILHNKRVEVKIAVPRDGIDGNGINYNGRHHRGVGRGSSEKRSSTRSSSYADTFYPNYFPAYSCFDGYIPSHQLQYGSNGFYGGYFNVGNPAFGYGMAFTSPQRHWNNQGLVSATHNPHSYSYPLMFPGYSNNYGYLGYRNGASKVTIKFPRQSDNDGNDAQQPMPVTETDDAAQAPEGYTSNYGYPGCRNGASEVTIGFSRQSDNDGNDVQQPTPDIETTEDTALAPDKGNEPNPEPRTTEVAEAPSLNPDEHWKVPTVEIATH